MSRIRNWWTLGVAIFLSLLIVIIILNARRATVESSVDEFLQEDEVASFSTRSSYLGRVQGNFIFTHPAQVSGQEHQVHFTPDGKFVVYVTRLGDNPAGPQTLVVNNEIGPEYKNIFSRIAISPDSHKIVYAAKGEEKGALVIEELPSRSRTEDTRFDYVINPMFSEDGKHLAFSAGISNRGSMLVFDNKESSWIDPSRSLRNFAISPDGFRIASVQASSAEGKELILRIGDKVIGKYEDISNLTFSPDGERLAFTVRRGDSRFVIVDSKEYGPYSLTGTISFSPDSKRIAWVAHGKDGGSWKVVIDGQEQTLPQLEGKERVVLNGHTKIVFSQDGKYISYVMNKLPKHSEASADSFVVTKNLEDETMKIGEIYNWVDPTSLTFSPNDEVAYIARKRLRSHIVIGDKEGRGKYNYIGKIRFSSKGSVVGYGVKSGQKFRWIVERVK